MQRLGQRLKIEPLVPPAEDHDDLARRLAQGEEQAVGRRRFGIVDEADAADRRHMLHPVLQPAEGSEHLPGQRIRNAH